MLYLDERSYREIAEVLGMTETNVATRLSRLKQRIRSRMTAASH
jgi:RNA polymerase sigma-70 factor (ECF subfamily)